MASFVLINPKIFMGQYDLSLEQNQVGLTFGRQAVDATKFGSTTKGNRLGPKKVNFNGSGFTDFALLKSDSILWSQINANDVPISVTPDAGTVGDVAYFFNALLASYNPSGSHGEMMAFAIDAESGVLSGTEHDLVRGDVHTNKIMTASENSIGVQLGAISSTQKIAAVIHVTAASGTAPTLDAHVESHDDINFELSNNVGTNFTQITTIGYEIKTVAGPITDDWFRLHYTLGGGSPSFTIFAAIGVI